MVSIREGQAFASGMGNAQHIRINNETMEWNINSGITWVSPGGNAFSGSQAILASATPFHAAALLPDAPLSSSRFSWFTATMRAERHAARATFVSRRYSLSARCRFQMRLVASNTPTASAEAEAKEDAVNGQDRYAGQNNGSRNGRQGESKYNEHQWRAPTLQVMLTTCSPCPYHTAEWNVVMYSNE